MSIDFASLLIFLSFILLIMEIIFASSGIFTFIGLVSFIIGTYFLYIGTKTLPYVFLYVILPLFFASFVFVVFVVILGLKAQKTSVKTTENLVSRTGICTKEISKNTPGQIEIEGEIWTAFSDENIQVGDKISVLKQESLKLFVKKEV